MYIPVIKFYDFSSAQFPVFGSKYYETVATKLLYKGLTSLWLNHSSNFNLRDDFIHINFIPYVDAWSGLKIFYV